MSFETRNPSQAALSGYGGRTRRPRRLWGWAATLAIVAVMVVAPGSVMASQDAPDTAKEAAALAAKSAQEAQAALAVIAKAMATAGEGLTNGSTESRIMAAGLVESLKARRDDAEKAIAMAQGAAAKAAQAASRSDVPATLQAAAEAASAAQRASEAATAAEAAVKPASPEAPQLDTGDTAWMLVSSALVLLMVPGLALFYAGMVRSKNVLGTMMHSMAALAIIGVQWVVIGYAMTFGGTCLAVVGSGENQAGLVGWSSDLFLLRGVAADQIAAGLTIPVLVHMMFQGKFAIITPALISGAIAERVRFSTYMVFIFLWGILVYNPLAHWVWADGFLGAKGVRALDFAGGTVVHLSAGISALACILLLPARRLNNGGATLPHSLVLTLTGAGLLWFGWFGFNAGSALAAGADAGRAFATTQTATAAAGLVWMMLEMAHRGKPTALGLASGLVAGLVGITPAAGFVDITGALIVGAAASAVCYGFVTLKPILGYDDTLDVVGIHGVGGLIGALLTGVLFVSVPDWAMTGEPAALPSVGTQFVRQLIAVGIAGAYAFVVSAVLVIALDKTLGFSLDAEAEDTGLDRSQHGESGYHLTS